MEEMVLVYTSVNRPIRWAIFCGVYSYGALLSIVSPKDPWMMPIGLGAVRVVLKRMLYIAKGQYVDAPRFARDDRIFDLPKLTPAELEQNYISAPLPKMKLAEKCRQLIQQPYILGAALPITFLGQKKSNFHG